MWTVLLLVHAAGVAVPALSVLRNRLFSHGCFVDAASVVL
jgi:hypothetical protein